MSPYAEYRVKLLDELKALNRTNLIHKKVGHTKRLKIVHKIKLWDAVHTKDFWDTDEQTSNLCKDVLTKTKDQRQN